MTTIEVVKPGKGGWVVTMEPVAEDPSDVARKLGARGLIVKLLEGGIVRVKATDLCTLHYQRHPCPRCPK